MVSDCSQAAKDRYGRVLRYVAKRGGYKDLSYRQAVNGYTKRYVSAASRSPATGSMSTLSLRLATTTGGCGTAAGDLSREAPDLLTRSGVSCVRDRQAATRLLGTAGAHPQLNSP